MTGLVRVPQLGYRVVALQIILGSSLNNVVPHRGLFANRPVDPDHDGAVLGHDGEVLTQPGKGVDRIAAGETLQVSHVSRREKSMIDSIGGGEDGGNSPKPTIVSVPSAPPLISRDGGSLDDPVDVLERVAIGETVVLLGVDHRKAGGCES